MLDELLILKKINKPDSICMVFYFCSHQCGDLRYNRGIYRKHCTGNHTGDVYKRQVNKGLKKLKDNGEYDQIYEKFFSGENDTTQVQIADNTGIIGTQNIFRLFPF